MKQKYSHYYWLLDQRFDFLIPWFQEYYGIEERKQITFVGSFHGAARTGEEWNGVAKELVKKDEKGELIYIGPDHGGSAAGGKAVWLEPEDVNRAYSAHMNTQEDTFVVAFSGACLPEGVDSFMSTGELALKLNNKWEQYLLISGLNETNRKDGSAEERTNECPEILIPETAEIRLHEKSACSRREELKEAVRELISDGKWKKAVIKRSDLSGGYCMCVISDESDLERYCDSLGDEEFERQFLISEYIPHEQSFAGIGIVGKRKNSDGKASVTYCGMTEQVLYRELAYEGLFWPAFWNPDLERSIDARKADIGRITERIGEELADLGYFGFYNVDFIEEAGTGNMYVAEINARFGFGTILYALMCGKERFFDAIRGNDPPLLNDEDMGDRRILLGKIKGVPGRQYKGLSDVSEIESWFTGEESFRTCYLRDETFGYGSFAGLFGEKVPAALDRESALEKFMDICLLRGKV